jgi:hypothetical protein
MIPPRFRRRRGKANVAAPAAGPRQGRFRGIRAGQPMIG